MVFMTKVREALLSLLADCDGAKKEDGRGFNKFDTDFARDVAGKEWTDNIENAVYDMLEKYKKQLKYNHNIEYEELEFETKKEENKSDKVIDFDKNLDELRVKFDYDKDLVSDIKMVKGRKFDGEDKDWLVPLNKESINDLREFVKKHKFDVTDKAIDEIEKAKNKNPKNVTIKNDKIAIEFPYDEELINKVKNLSNRKWNKDKKRWEIDINKKNCEEVIEFGEENEFDISDKVLEKCEECKDNIEKSKASNVDEDLEIDVGGDELELKPFQKAGVMYSVDKEKAIIADEVGLGKTVQALATIKKRNAFPVLVICPASLKINWRKEVRKWIGDDVSVNIVEGRDNKEIEKADVVIINYDILDMSDEVKEKRNVDKTNIELLKEHNFEGLIVDESHKLKNHKALRTKAVKDFIKDKEIPVRLLLSATPFKNRPKELISQLDILDRLEDLGGFWGFAKKFCNAYKGRWGWDMSGASNLDEMNELLREKCFIRREKKDVVEELEDVNRIDVHVNIDNRSEYRHAEENIISYITENEGREKARKALRAEVLVRLSKLKALTAEGKKKAVLNWVENFLETGEKLVLFAHHRDLVSDIAEEFDALKIQGGMKKEKKDKAVEEFQNNPDEQLIVISIKSGGEGLTLTEAHNVATVELGWTPADHDQAEGRCYGRLNDLHSINSYYLIAENTIEEDILDLIEKKRKIFEEGINGSSSVSQDEMVDELIDRLKEKRGK